MYQRVFVSKIKQKFFHKMWSKLLNFGGYTSMALYHLTLKHSEDQEITTAFFFI